jgi:hypothetical protein
MKRVGRALLSIATALGIVFTATPALAADEWSPSGAAPDNATCRSADSTIYGASVNAGVCWNSYSDVRVVGNVFDTAEDGHSAVMRMRYQVYTTSWSGWHYRNVAVASGVNDVESWGWQRATYLTRNLQIRACRSDAGTITNCDSSWH